VAPDSSKYKKVIEAVPRPTVGPNGQGVMDRGKFEKWHAKACDTLKELAKEIIPKFHQIRKDVNEYAMLRQASTKMGFTGVNDQTFEGAQEAMKDIMGEVAKVQKEANSLRPGQPGWDAAIFQEATDEIRLEEAAKVKAREERRAKREAAEEAGEDVPSDDESDGDDEELWWLMPLRFAIGTRVTANMGAKGFKPGYVLGNWRLPYLVQLETGDRITAPRDNDSLIRLYDAADVQDNDDEDEGPKKMPLLLPNGKPDIRLWRPYRFKPGQPVTMKMKDDWKTGYITMLNWRAPKWPPGQFAAYQVKLDDSDGLFFCLRDTDDHIKKLDLNPQQLEALKVKARALAAKQYAEHMRMQQMHMQQQKQHQMQQQQQPPPQQQQPKQQPQQQQKPASKHGDG